jgi:putative transposase
VNTASRSAAGGTRADAGTFGSPVASAPERDAQRPRYTRRQCDQLAKDLKPIYTATDVDAAQEVLERFDEEWGKQLPLVLKAWWENWEYVIPFMAFPPDIRRVIYTTDPIEALHRQLRKAIKTKGHFPAEEAAKKLIYLCLVNATPKWTRVAGWTKALLAFKIHFEDRLPD